MAKRSTADRFWSKVAVGEPDQCWLWQAALNKQGYGQFWDSQRRVMGLAHRAAFVLAGGDLPDRGGQFGPGGVLVLHSCDNPPCVNPAHLSTGDHARNMFEASQRERYPRRTGEQNIRAKLAAWQVQEIRDGYSGALGEKSAIARQYGISTAQVSKILLGQSWRSER